MSRAACLALLLVLLPAAASRAEPAPAAARLVADIRTPPLATASSRPRALTPARDLLYFDAEDGFSGVELWAADGTAGGTRRVADLCPGPCSSYPQKVTPAGRLVYFLADVPPRGQELWRSDGTAAGTWPLVDIAPGPAPGPYLGAFSTAGSRLFFAVLRRGRQELWTSDGTPGGTRRLVELESVTLLAPAGGAMLFVGGDPAHGQELWRSDGTAAGTFLIRDIAPGGESSLSAGNANVAAAQLGGRLYFAAFDAVHGIELWRSDGTAAGTRLVRDLLPGAGSSSPFYLRAAGGTLYFVALGPTGGALWTSDGTATGTRLVDGQPGPPLFLRPLQELGSSLLFLAEHVTGAPELWITDRGTGTRRLESWPEGYQLGPVAPAGGGALFLLGGDRLELWSTDGTPGGTAPLLDVAETYELVSFRGLAWFSHTTAGPGSELWRSDGTAAGTRLFADLYAGLRSSAPADLVELGGALVFSADDGAHGRELWRSDGTAAGTALLGDLAPADAPEGREPGPIVLGRSGAALLFATTDGALWRTAGVPGDAVRLRQGLGEVQPARAAGGLVYFTAAVLEEPEWYREWVVSLWRSDGTAAGTVALAEIARGPADGHFPSLLAPPAQREFAVIEDDLYFFSDGLWRSDGTPAGTVRLLEEPCVPGCAQGAGITAVGATLYFTKFQFDGDRVRHVLWRSDATAAGTYPLRVVLDVSAADHGAEANGFALGQLTASGNRLFFVADDAVHGAELWVSDGTAAGTRMVRDLRPGAAGSQPAWLTPWGGGVLFAADGGLRGLELWRSDGSGPSTRLVRDIAPGTASSFPQELAVVDGVLLFAAFEPAHGLEVWRSDGTAAGTRLLADAFPGPGSSAPRSFTRAGATLFFVAGRPQPGYELFRMSPAGGPF